MPAKSEKQLRLIYAIRNRYKSRSKAPKKWKWVFKKEWGRLEESSSVMSFSEFSSLLVE